ncbi:Isonitrile hydratase [Pseudocercospora fuligena]|uniref:Isonitrile hydratase n=1 Tax=Pseudocercospora fuligena TaxID=685502 RepID=A0A8H6RX91_9PEZI|nr:Isonitrile hydratase [Pseudocercospora fuligena]
MADQKIKDFPKSFGALYFPGFEVLDIAGPLEALNCLSRFPGFEDLKLSIISKTLDPISVGENSFMNSQKYLPTHTFKTAPQLDVLLIPGGVGAAPTPFPDGTDFTHMKEYLDFIRSTYHGSGGRKPLKYIISICNGAGLLAGSGILDGKKATTNKDFFKQVAALGPKTHWVSHARWVNDGNIWTTSGVSAGADGVLAWMSSLLPEETVKGVVDGMEWIRAKTAENDPFAGGLEDVRPLR